jgi:hypothetical protein
MLKVNTQFPMPCSDSTKRMLGAARAKRIRAAINAKRIASGLEPLSTYATSSYNSAATFGTLPCSCLF